MVHTGTVKASRTLDLGLDKPSKRRKQVSKDDERVSLELAQLVRCSVQSWLNCRSARLL